MMMKSLCKNRTFLILVLLIGIGILGVIVVKLFRGLPRLTGNVITKTLTPQTLSEFTFEGPFNINLTQSTTNEIKITADESLFKCLSLEEKTKKIHFTCYRRGNLFFRIDSNDVAISIDLSSQQLETLHVGGLSTISSDALLLDKEFTLDLYGISKADLNINAPKVRVDLSGISALTLATQSEAVQLEVGGISKVDVRGSTAKLEVMTSSIGKLDASALAAEKAYLDASGISEIIVNAKEMVTSKSSGISSIKNIRE